MLILFSLYNLIKFNLQIYREIIDYKPNVQVLYVQTFSYLERMESRLTYGHNGEHGTPTTVEERMSLRAKVTPFSRKQITMNNYLCCATIQVFV